MVAMILDENKMEASVCRRIPECLSKIRYECALRGCGGNCCCYRCCRFITCYWGYPCILFDEKYCHRSDTDDSSIDEVKGNDVSYRKLSGPETKSMDGTDSYKNETSNEQNQNTTKNKQSAKLKSKFTVDV